MHFMLKQLVVVLLIMIGQHDNIYRSSGNVGVGNNSPQSAGIGTIQI